MYIAPELNQAQNIVHNMANKLCAVKFLLDELARKHPETETAIVAIKAQLNTMHKDAVFQLRMDLISGDVA
jgi:hypothetical protein